MRLFEIINGYMGESYVRCYAWAETEAQALDLAREQFRAEEMRKKYGQPRPTYWERLQVTELFNGNVAPFATVPTDDGWPVESDSHATD